MLSIGIDLGTTNSVASWFADARPVVVPNRDGLPLTPSVVGFRRDSSGRDEFLVGNTAVNYAVQAPRDTVYSVKRLMGLHFDDPKVQEVLRRVPYKICEQSAVNDVGVRVQIGGRLFTPIEVSTIILKRVREDCEHRLARSVDAATITVPAYFLDSQRNATREAGIAAGLRLHPLLDEPIAAALSFGFGRDDKERLLVYDLGGGTFDVSLIQMAGDNLQVISKRGNMWLGGDDFDQVIISYIADWLRAKYGIDGVSDPGARRLLKHAAEHAKKTLSDKPVAQILEPKFTAHPGGETVTLDLAITRDQFEAGIRPFVEESLSLVEDVLKEASVSPSRLTGVLLVGGSTLVPLVRRSLAERFGAEKLRYDVDPMTCVSLGAAAWCRRFPFEASGKISLVNYARTGIPTPMDLGVEVYCDGNCRHFEPIVRRNTTYPTPKGAYSKQFFPTVQNQKLIRIPIFQGNSKSTTLNSYQGLIEEQLPQSVPLKTPIMISFEIDEHGNLSGEIDFQGFPELRRKWSIQRNQALLPQDEQERLKNWKANADNAVSVAGDFLEKYGAFLTADEAAEFAALLQKARAALADGDRVECQTQTRALELFVFGAGAASTLFIAQRAQQLAGATGAAKEIAKTRKQLEDAVRANKPTDVALLKEKLRRAVDQVYSAQSHGGPQGPLAGQVTPATQ